MSPQRMVALAEGRVDTAIERLLSLMPAGYSAPEAAELRAAVDELRRSVGRDAWLRAAAMYRVPSPVALADWRASQ